MPHSAPTAAPELNLEATSLSDQTPASGTPATGPGAEQAGRPMYYEYKPAETVRNEYQRAIDAALALLVRHPCTVAISYLPVVLASAQAAASPPRSALNA